MIHCMLTVLQMHKSWTCGENCFDFDFTSADLLSSCSLHSYATYCYRWWWRAPFLFNFVSSLESHRLSGSSLVGYFVLFWLEVFFTALRRITQDLYSVWKVFVWRVAWVCVPLFRSGWFLFLFWISCNSMKMLGGPPCGGSISLRYLCTYLCCLLDCCTSHR